MYVTRLSHIQFISQYIGGHTTVLILTCVKYAGKLLQDTHYLQKIQIWNQDQSHSLQSYYPSHVTTVMKDCIL